MKNELDIPMQEVIIMLDKQTNLPFTDRALFGYTHEALLIEIIKDMLKK